MPEETHVPTREALHVPVNVSTDTPVNSNQLTASDTFTITPTQLALSTTFITDTSRDICSNDNGDDVGDNCGGGDVGETDDDDEGGGPNLNHHSQAEDIADTVCPPPHR